MKYKKINFIKYVTIKKSNSTNELMQFNKIKSKGLFFFSFLKTKDQCYFVILLYQIKLFD